MPEMLTLTAEIPSRGGIILRRDHRGLWGAATFGWGSPRNEWPTPNEALAALDPGLDPEPHAELCRRLLAAATVGEEGEATPSAFARVRLQRWLGDGGVTWVSLHGGEDGWFAWINDCTPSRGTTADEALQALWEKNRSVVGLDVVCARLSAAAAAEDGEVEPGAFERYVEALVAHREMGAECGVNTVGAEDAWNARCGSCTGLTDEQWKLALRLVRWIDPPTATPSDPQPAEAPEPGGVATNILPLGRCGPYIAAVVHHCHLHRPVVMTERDGMWLRVWAGRWRFSEKKAAAKARKKAEKLARKAEGHE